ncbi:MAG: hypothetical protein K2M17_02725 [Bacilli bacterium]|nr:hypothetical protein [Bacilli bacterium]
MRLEDLLKMKDAELKQEYANARRQNNMEDIILINTVRIRNIILSTLYNFSYPKGKLVYYENNGQTYFSPQVKEYTPTLRGNVEWLIMAHVSGRSPVPVNIELLRTLISSECVEFEKSSKQIVVPSQENVINYNYTTEDVIGITLPDVWVPNGEEELQVAVADMPKNDSTAVLLTDCTSCLIIGDHVTSNKTFTDVFYSHNENMPKAIILNDIAGIDGAMLESELQKQGVGYTKKENVSNEQRMDTDKKPINLNLSTIWTAKFIEIIEDAIRDSEESVGFTPTPAKIYNTPSQIVTNIQYDGQTIGVKANYNTVILFDGKLILFDGAMQDDKRADVIKLFQSHGLTAMVVDEPIDLHPFENSENRAM